VLSYNVRSLRDDPAAVAAVVRSCAPDVVAVQEAPRFLRWRSKRAALARECGLVVATADRPGGLLVMVSLRAAVLDTSAVLLPLTQGRHRRAVVSAVIEAGGARWRIADIHLSVDAAERQRHLSPLRSALAVPSQGPGPPLVVAGDVNEEPSGPVFSALAAALQDCFAVAGQGDGHTVPAATSRRRIDAIFAESPIEVVSCEVVNAPGAAAASDHLPVLAVLRQSRL
jgi:endonuclease/exonuclease/phosphatase family metal-dependent hydrolase